MKKPNKENMIPEKSSTIIKTVWCCASYALEVFAKFQGTFELMLR